jgi:hypothetical protein
MRRFFTKVFQALDFESGGTLFNIDGELIIPKNERVRLVIANALGLLSLSSLKPYYLTNDLSWAEELAQVSPPMVTMYPDVSRKGLSDIAQTYDSANILVQQFRTEDSKDRMNRRIWYNGEGIGTLISTFYLRTRGYMIGSGSYGTVNDVVAWKSPFLDKLRDYGFIDQGCTLLELACLRRLPQLVNGNKSSATTRELVLVEVERSSTNGLSNSSNEGLNQLRAASNLEVATSLYICYPISEQAEDTPERIRVAIDDKWCNKPKVGSILFDDKGLYVYHPDNASTEQCNAEIEHLEKQAKATLLVNFSFSEILEFAKKLNIPIENRSFEDIGQNLKSEIVDRADITEILEKLKQECARDN